MLLLLLSGAVVRYYETKRKIYLQSLPENKEKADQQKEENKLRSRRKRVNYTFFLMYHCLVLILSTRLHDSLYTAYSIMGANKLFFCLHVNISPLSPIFTSKFFCFLYIMTSEEG